MRYDISAKSKPRKREYVWALLAFLLAAGYLGRDDHIDRMIAEERKLSVAECRKAIEQANRHAEVLIAAMNGKYFYDGETVFSCRPRFYMTGGL